MMKKTAVIFLFILVSFEIVFAGLLRDEIPTFEYGIWKLGNTLNNCMLDIDGINPIATVDYLWNENMIKIRLFYSLDHTGKQYILEDLKKQGEAVVQSLKNGTLHRDTLPTYFVRDGSVSMDKAKKWKKILTKRTELLMVFVLKNPSGCEGVCVMRGETGLKTIGMDWTGPVP
jgi:hypothetical protein